MKTQKHTPGPPVKVQFFDDAGHVVREAIGTRAARIVACVNACEGINPEAVPLILEALHAAEDELMLFDSSMSAETLKKIRAAIAAATKGGIRPC